MDSDITPRENTGALGTMDAASPDDEIERTRAEIDATRTDMAATLEAIKDKLNPADLMDQAKDKVTEITGDLAEKAKDTVHHIVEDATTHAKDAVTEAVTGTVDTAKEAVGNVVHTAQDVVGGVVDTAKNAGTTVIDTIKRNPIPSALAVFGATWLYLKNRDTGRSASVSYPTTPTHSSGSMIDQARQYGNTIEEGNGHTSRAQSESEEGTTMGIINVIQRNPIPAAIAGCAVTWLYLKSQDENKAYRADNRYAPVGGAEWQNGTSHGMIESVTDKIGQAKDAAGNLIDTAKDKATNLTDAAKEKASHLTDAAKQQVGAIGAQAGKVSSSVSDSFQSSPLPIGMVAAGVGMAVGLLVPESERENQWMGATRDRLMDKAQETAQDIAGKVQTVAQETFEAAKTTVQHEARNQGLMGNEQESGSSSNSNESSPFSPSPQSPLGQMQDAFDAPAENIVSDRQENSLSDEEI